MVQTMESDGQYSIELCDDSETWNSFVKRNNGPVYVHWGWSEAVSSYGHEIWHLVVRNRTTDAIEAVLPLYHVESRLFGSQLLSPAFAERGSVILNEDNTSIDAKRLLLEQTKTIADNLKVDVVSLRGSQVSDVDDFIIENSYVTFQVPVTRGGETIWADIKDSRQRQISQAAENPSIQFRVGNSLEELQDYYQLYLRTMHGHGSPPHSFEFFKILWEQFHESGNFRLSMITHNGSMINGMIDLALGSSMYQWGVVSDYEQRNLNGGSLLLWKSLKWASENGYETYEFGRTREGSGVYLFKKSFGGAKVWYDDLHYFPDGAAELPDPEDDKYERAKTLWQRIPLPVTRVIGPQIRKRIGI